MNREREKPYQYWLMNVKGIGKKGKIELLQKLGSAEELYKASDKILRAAAGELQAEKFKAAKKGWHILGEYEKLCLQKIKFTYYGDKDYPKRLTDIPDPPFSLYYQGELPVDTIPSAAIIGARTCSEYGTYVAREFGSKLAQAGIQIISGLAMGIDGIAQEAALAAGGDSFGILGNGVDICYPKCNREIYEKCKVQGGILSEYAPGMQPAANLFPPRNRIISGLSDVVIVVEARKKSGTLITVDMALEQGREVFAVPGRITDALSSGCNNLFKQGAGVALSPGDILDAVYGICMPHYNIEETARGTVKKDGAEHILNRTDVLSAEEKEIYGYLGILPKTAEELCEQMGKTVAIQEVMGILVELCIKGFVKQTLTGYVQKPLAS